MVLSAEHPRNNTLRDSVLKKSEERDGGMGGGEGRGRGGQNTGVQVGVKRQISNFTVL